MTEYAGSADETFSALMANCQLDKPVRINGVQGKRCVEWTFWIKICWYGDFCEPGLPTPFSRRYWSDFALQMYYVIYCGARILRLREGYQLRRVGYQNILSFGPIRIDCHRILVSPDFYESLTHVVRPMFSREPRIYKASEMFGREKNGVPIA